MTDFVPITPGSGANIVTDTLPDGRRAQVVKLMTGADGADGGVVTTANPLPTNASHGELIEAMEALRFAVAALTRSIGMALPGAAGFPIMEARQATAANLAVLANIPANQTLATLTTLTNQQQAGGFALQDQLPATMHMQCDGLRANIVVT